jgi:acetyl esterase/lipase
MEWTISWAQLIAASGLIAVAYTNREPEADLHALLDYLRQNAAAMGIDGEKMAIVAASGHAPLALSVVMSRAAGLRCAAFSCGYMLDVDGSTGVAGAAATWGFVNPCAGKTIDDMPDDVPLFIARAGLDHFPHVNEMLDRFVADAVRRNLPITFVNHAKGPHGFDLFDDSEMSREIVRAILAFLRFHLASPLVPDGDRRAAAGV